MKPIWKSRTAITAGLLALCSFVVALGDLLPGRVVAIASALSGSIILFLRIADKRTFDRATAKDVKKSAPEKVGRTNA
jgi:hypothetical protein